MIFQELLTTAGDVIVRLRNQLDFMNLNLICYPLAVYNLQSESIAKQNEQINM
jgi:hypothetical protein